MNNNFQKPINQLNLEDIKNLMLCIRYSKTLPDIVLYDFLIVKSRLHETLSIPIRDFIVIQWLNEIISSQLKQYRRLYDLNSNELNNMQKLEKDFQQGNTTLEAWSILFYRYINIDLQLTTQQLENITSVSTRTLRRRQELGYQRLYQHIVQLELEAYLPSKPF